MTKQHIKTTASNRLFNNKWLMRIALTIGIAGGVVAEGTWLIKIKYGRERPIIERWLENNENLRRIVGDIQSTEIEGVHSTYSLGFGSSKSGRFRFLVNGTKSELDVLVTWHEEQPDHVVIDKVVSYADPQAEAIWRSPTP